eukprot:6196355-Pleurochrysis_carterae.AAC.1
MKRDAWTQKIEADLASVSSHQCQRQQRFQRGLSSRSAWYGRIQKARALTSCENSASKQHHKTTLIPMKISSTSAATATFGFVWGR